MNKTVTLEIAMLCYWWLFSLVTPVVFLDALWRSSPLYFAGAWPLGFDHLAADY